VGLQSHPGRVEESRPPRREKHGRQGAERQRDPARPAPAIVVAHLPTRALGPDRGADFFTSEVWTPRGLVTYYTLFVIDLQTLRVHVVGSTPNPDAAFMARAARCLTDAVDGSLANHPVLICDRDGKWTEEFRRIVEGSGVRLVLTPFQVPNANALRRAVRTLDPRGVSRSPDSLRRTAPTACARRVRGALP
jgi:hypothetical protein